jgi:hypothetical protein
MNFVFYISKKRKNPQRLKDIVPAHWRWCNKPTTESVLNIELNEGC